MSRDIATFGSKYQFTIPKRVATALGLKPGHKVLLTVRGKRIVLTPMRSVVVATAGSLHSHIPPEKLAHPAEEPA